MIAKPVNERYKRIADGLAAADAGQKELESARAEAKDDRARGARARPADRGAGAAPLARGARGRQAGCAREGARIIAAGQAEAANEAARARDELRREFGSLVVRGASQLLEREIDPRAHAQLIERLTEEIARG